MSVFTFSAVAGGPCRARTPARREREGLKDYRGGILWQEGEIHFKKDCTLQGAMPIPLWYMRCPTDVARSFGTLFLATEAEGFAPGGVLRDDKTPLRFRGRLRSGGYAALMTTPVRYQGLLVPPGMDFCYSASLASPISSLFVGLGHDGQQIKAGTVLRYAFGVGTFANNQPTSALLEHTVKAMNMGGGQAGYPVTMQAGTVEDATFFFTAQAKDNEAAFTLGPQSLIIDLPIRVRGLTDNGCAAVYSADRQWYRFIPVDEQGIAWFQESIDKENQMWVGNVFVCDNPAVKLILVVDGQAQGKPPFLEVHNPTDQEIALRCARPPTRRCSAG